MTQYLEAAKQVINLYPQIKEIVSDSRPVVTANEHVAAAIPHDADPMSMVAAGTSYRTVNYRAEWGIPIIGPDWTTTCTIHLAWAYGARYHGFGAFIPAVQCWVSDIDPSTGQDLTITIQSEPPYVQGEENAPYAVLPVKIICHEESLTDNHHEEHMYYLYGYGGSQAG